MKSEAWNLVFTGLSLTGITAAGLFLLVAVNPKDAAYGGTPLVYAGGSVLLAIGFNRAAAWVARSSAAGQAGNEQPK